MAVHDQRTGTEIRPGDVVCSVERGDLLRVEGIGGADALGRPRVTLSPLSRPFEVSALKDEETGLMTLDGYWKA